MITAFKKNKEHFESQIGDYFELSKPKVMRLVIFTAAVAMVAAPGSIHPLIALASLLCVAIGAGAAGALNMWWEADLDAVMKRTSKRPIPSGRISSADALAFGVILAMLSVMMLSIFANLLSALILAVTILFYLLIYTIWLKRLTPQNIVIGGAAGAFPPIIGWCIVSGDINIESVLMFLLIFIWTPPHFWTLALFVKDEYSDARVPMLTVTHGPEVAKRQIIVYICLLCVLTLIMSFSKIGGPIFLFISTILNVIFVIRCVQLLPRTIEVSSNDNYRLEKKAFVFSIYYLFLIFFAIGVEAVMRVLGVGAANWPYII